VSVFNNDRCCLLDVANLASLGDGKIDFIQCRSKDHGTCTFLSPMYLTRDSQRASENIPTIIVYC